MSLTPSPRTPALAKFRTVSPGETVEVTVHFNPASLQYTLTNNVEPAPGGRKVQYVSQTTAKLSMELTFDTTHSGHDVREDTLKMARLLQPLGPDGQRTPPVVEFTWGTYGFRGTVEQFRETLDFFSPEGVPLRSGISLTLTTNEATFSADTSARTGVAGDDGGGDVARMPAPPGGPAGAASALGRPDAARAIASANASASLRFSAGAELAVGAGAGVKLQAAAAFSAGASAGAGFGLGIGGGAGLGLSAGAQFSAGAGAGAGFGAAAGFSGGASAGLGLSAGAGVGLSASGGVGGPAGLQADFSGLRAGVSVSPQAALPSARSAFALTSTAPAQGAAFGVGGRLQGGAGASLAVDVSGDGGLNSRLKFGP
ncbi:CIS tube protein [Azohydromonas lata]|uniref:Contractile injection system tube protein N-terminal domain-containing protein n=1 Tax=Azohydromonas lata TaxID=45677 RepID=A0ABU5IQW2_9BURK|nr:hypothetical protein [Azohydromonas lata]MDZ5461292.1 hypothetical protein [Azohydromonas lata]